MNKTSKDKFLSSSSLLLYVVTSTSYNLFSKHNKKEKEIKMGS